MNTLNNIRMLSANCQGLRNKEKRRDVILYFKEKNPNIVCLQDTHLTEDDINEIKSIWDIEIYISGGKTNSRGVMILLNNNFEHEVLSCKKDKNGNQLTLLLKLNSMTINLTTIYGPNSDSPEFFQDIFNNQERVNSDYNIICGDFNIALDQHKDTNNYKHLNNPKATQMVNNLMTNHDIIDIYRKLHPDKKRYTWRRKNPVKQARLDYYLASAAILDIIKSCLIKASYRSDHSIIEIEIQTNNFTKGKGLWKFNNSLLESQEYLNLVNKIIQEEKTRYAIPIYNLEFLKHNTSKIQLKIDDDLFLEVLMLQLRGQTIKFASMQKKKQSKQKIS